MLKIEKKQIWSFSSNNNSREKLETLLETLSSLTEESDRSEAIIQLCWSWPKKRLPGKLVLLTDHLNVVHEITNVVNTNTLQH